MDYRKETMDIFDQSASKQYRENDEHLVGMVLANTTVRLCANYPAVLAKKLMSSTSDVEPAVIFTACATSNG